MVGVGGWVLLYFGLLWGLASYLSPLSLSLSLSLSLISAGCGIGFWVLG